MTRDEITTGLSEILEEVAGVGAADVTDDKSLTKDLGIDSLSMVEIVVAAEERFAIKVPDGEMQKLQTVGDVVSFVLTHGPHAVRG